MYPYTIYHKRYQVYDSLKMPNMPHIKRKTKKPIVIIIEREKKKKEWTKYVLHHRFPSTVLKSEIFSTHKNLCLMNGKNLTLIFMKGKNPTFKNSG